MRGKGGRGKRIEKKGRRRLRELKSEQEKPCKGRVDEKGGRSDCVYARETRRNREQE